MRETKTDIVIVDDDELTGALMRDLMEQAGYCVFLLHKPLDLIPVIRRRKPELVIMDIMLAGINGLKLIKIIKGDAGIAKTKIVVVTEKDFEFEKQQAFKYGVEAFIKKPFNVETLAGQVRHIMSGDKQNLTELYGGLEEDEDMADIEAAESDLKEHQVRITVWGCRGIPPVLANTESAYGRQTSCVSVETRDKLFIFDGGTGIIRLGEHLKEHGNPKDIWLFLTHFHIDHIAGLPHFACLQNPGFTLRLVGAGETERKFRDAVRDIFYASPYWHAKHPRAKLMMYEISEDVYELAPGFRLRAMHANHPSVTMAYRLELEGKTIVYAPDSALIGDPSAMQAYDEKLGEFARKADILIHDSCLSDEDLKLRPEEGHSSPSTAAEFAAMQAEAKRLLFFHYNGTYTDEIIEMMTSKAKKLAEDNDWEVECITAREGLTITLN
jgi:ribonuclease BN (tRNA processing enzyme)/CheY-like chemotaxis protein